MDYRHTGDIDHVESARLAQAGVTPAVNGDMLTPETRQSYESSTPLLSTLTPNSNDVEASQPQAPSSSDEEPPFIGIWPAVIVFVAVMLPPFIVILSFPILIGSGKDPLGFSFLAFLLLFSLVPCGLGIVFLVRVCSFHLQVIIVRRTLTQTQSAIMGRATPFFFKAVGIDPAKLHSKQRVLPAYLVFSWSLLVIYLIFYGTALIWASSRPVADLIDDHGVWHDFQAKVNVPDSLDLLTRCLQERGQGWATVEDFAFCAKDIGIKSAGG